jgi:hypothetical protein
VYCTPINTVKKKTIFLPERFPFEDRYYKCLIINYLAWGLMRNVNVFANVPGVITGSTELTGRQSFFLS